MDITWKKKKRITSLPLSLTTSRNICILAFPVLSSEPISCKFGICQVGFKRHSDRLSSSFSHLLSALSGWIYVRVTPTHIAKVFNMNKKKNILQYRPCLYHLWYGSVSKHCSLCFSIWFLVCYCVSVCYCRSISHQTTLDRDAVFDWIIDDSNKIINWPPLCNM